MSGSLRSLKAYDAHHYPRLVQRWRQVEKSHKLAMCLLIEAGGFPIYYLETRVPDPKHRWFYCSAGIHGDEAAGPEALIRWAERAKKIFQQLNVLLFPCLNPWGLVHNVRQDAQGHDLNRTYHSDNVPQTAAHKCLIAGKEFDLALFLHEDYDARGVYIYEIPMKSPFIGDRFIAAASRYIPADPRGVIEGARCYGGLIQRQVNPRRMPLAPEAFFLHFSLNSRSITVETPSEFHMDQRVAAHVAILQQAARYCCSLEARPVSCLLP